MAVTQLTQPIKRHGGKHYLGGWISSLMPPRCKNPSVPDKDDPGWLHYVEPYFGGGSVLLSMDPEGISEVVNDIDGELMTFWEVLQNEHDFKQFKRAVESIPFGETSWQESPRSDRPIDRAVAFFVRCRQSRQGLCKDFATLTRNRTRRGMNEQVSSWLTAIEGLPDVHERLRRVVILNRPAIDVIKQQDGPRTLLYLDPPYLHQTRVTTSDYEYEMSERDHVELLAAVASIEGRFLLSGYRNEIYDRVAEANGWRRVDKRIDNKASSAKTKEIKIESIWTNYDPPTPELVSTGRHEPIAKRLTEIASERLEQASLF